MLELLAVQILQQRKDSVVHAVYPVCELSLRSCCAWL